MCANDECYGDHCCQATDCSDHGGLLLCGDTCFDSPGWSTDGEDQNLNCESYDDELCADFGTKVSRFGCTPNQACCACGGGNVICSGTDISDKAPHPIDSVTKSAIICGLIGAGILGMLVIMAKHYLKCCHKRPYLEGQGQVVVARASSANIYANEVEMVASPSINLQQQQPSNPHYQQNNYPAAPAAAAAAPPQLSVPQPMYEPEGEADTEFVVPHQPHFQDHEFAIFEDEGI